MTTENLVYWLLRVVLAVGAVFILWKLVTWWVELESEARKQNKRIELAVLLIVLISLGISVLALVNNSETNANLERIENRIEALEKGSQTSPSPTP